MFSFFLPYNIQLVHRNSLQITATRACCNTLQHTATDCNTLRQTTTDCNRLQHTATSVRNRPYPTRVHTLICMIKCTLKYIRNTLQHTATHCNRLQHVTTQYTLSITGTYFCRRVVNERASLSTLHHTYCNTLQHTATHCNTLQQIATHYNAGLFKHTATYILQHNILQHTATYILQHTATQ